MYYFTTVTRLLVTAANSPPIPTPNLHQVSQHCCSCCWCCSKRITAAAAAAAVHCAEDDSVYQVAWPAAAVLPLAAGASFRTPLARAAAAACSWTFVASLHSRQRKQGEERQRCECGLSSLTQGVSVTCALALGCMPTAKHTVAQHAKRSSNYAGFATLAQRRFVWRPLLLLPNAAQACMHPALTRTTAEGHATKCILCCCCSCRGWAEPAAPPQC